ncbi:MAG: LysM peptidoglycan-binding domain-containing protein [Bacteroidota bacterium]|nr:LysM peptidoglycan-binding domain-containing protein [Bacteroidota bacterium]
MGIIKKIGFVFLVFCALNLSAQIIPDTVYFSGNKFVEHIVKGGESLKSIAALHKVKTSEIKSANELDRRLFYNQVIYIPIYLNNTNQELISVKKLEQEDDPLPWDYKSDNSITNIALLMPYYLLKNDAIFNKDTDALDISNRYYYPSDAALSFYVGVELAIDSLRRAGQDIILHTFDTNQDSLEVQKIVYSHQLNEMDIIIGPMYSNLFQMMCKKYGKDPTKILISPLSRDNKRITKFPAVYQIALTYKAQADILTNYLIENKLDERIIILNDEQERGLAAYLKHRFKKKNKTVESFQITNTQVDEIRKYFVEDQNVLLISKDKAFISTMLGAIGSIDSTSIVFSFESIMSYDNLDITNLMELDVHIPNSRSINFSNDYDLNFVSLFEKEFKTNVGKYSKEGYDIIMHFCGKANLYKFKRLKRGYYENIFAPIYHYSDFKLVPVD